MPSKNAVTILIVGDDADAVAQVRQRLQQAGGQVIVAADQVATLEALRQHAVQLILLDYRLPGHVDGLEFYAQMRAAGFDLPVILVTGSNSEATVIRAVRTSVRDFVTRPVDYSDFLLEAVEKVLRWVRTQQHLAESETWLAAVIDSAKDAVIIAQADQRITLFNKAAEVMFRCPAAAAIGQPLTLFIPKEVRAAFRQPDAGIDQPESLTHLVRTGSRGVRADATEFPLEASSSRTVVGGRKFHTIMVRDVTERRELEAKLRQAQRLESIGLLAGGVAHDFNNLLTVINGFGELVLRQLAQDHPLRPLIGQMIKAGERAAGLTRQLLAFSRKQVLAAKVLDLNAVVADVEKMLRRVIGEDIRLATNLRPGLWQIRADPGQIEQILMNLAVNARDAMPKGGKLTIETQNVTLDDAYPQSHPDARPGPYVLLAVSDTGHGMTPEVKAHIFEPFFTTKEKGKGTGLGLATVFGIVKQSGGQVEVYSEVGHGTSFKVYLPRVDNSSQSLERVGKPGHALVGSETILLVEDDEAVRALSRHVLAELGYTVLEAGDGREAQRIVQQHQAPIHLLIADVVMPELSGRQLAEELLRLRPEMKVLFLSGYTDDAVVRHGVLRSEANFLQKPFTPAVLAQKVREVLESAA